MRNIVGHKTTRAQGAQTQGRPARQPALVVEQQLPLVLGALERLLLPVISCVACVRACVCTRGAAVELTGAHGSPAQRATPPRHRHVPNVTEPMPKRISTMPTYSSATSLSPKTR